jgi:3D-(3,5/4)-trihydroxycyclohexane-1,2-dione acylhydrolase (decyclizing)
VIIAKTREAFSEAMLQARHIHGKPVCIITETDRRQRVSGYESWWEVAIPEVSDNPAVQQAREDYEENKAKERHHL